MRPDLAPAQGAADELVKRLSATLGKLEIALGATRDAIVWADERGSIQWCNAAFDRLAGRKRIELLGRGLAQTLVMEREGHPLPPESHPWARVLETRGEVNGTYEMRKEGALLTLEVHGTWAEVDDSSSLAVFTLRDISERTRAEDALGFWDRSPLPDAPPPAPAPASSGPGAPPFSGPVWPRWALAALLAAAYVLCGRLGLRFAFINASATPVWAPAGLALGAFLLWGGRVWPGIFLGAFLTNMLTAGTAAASLAIAAGNTLEGLLGAALVRRFADGPEFARDARSIFKFAALAAMASTAVGATLGAGVLCLARLAAWDEFGSVWLTWWLGDAVGDVLAAPLLVLWVLDPRVRWNRTQAAEGLLLLSVLFLLSQAVFGGWLPPSLRNLPLDFLCVPLLLWTAFRFSQRETAAVSFLLSAGAIWGTLHGAGPFQAGTPNTSLLLLQGFLGINTLTALALAAVVSGQRRTERALLLERGDLARRVRQRTAALSRANETLRLEIADRKKAETEFRSLLESAPDAMVMADSTGAIALLNGQAEKLFGYSRVELLGRPVELLLPERYRDGHVGHRRAYLKEPRPRPMGTGLELYGRRKDGTEFPVEISLSPIQTEGGPFAMSAIRDVTERKRAEEDLRSKTEEVARANSELGLFASIVSHELQEPLRKILTFGDLLKSSRLDPGSEEAQYAQRMQSSAGHMQQLVEDILTLCRTTTQIHPLEPVDLDEVFREVASDFKTRLEDCQGALETEALPTLSADRLQMRQLFTNLISNAIKFRKEGGKPRIRVSCRKPKPGIVEITVSDNGIGFEERFKEKIFRPFQRLNRRSDYAGSGIGLAICDRILFRHGGTITAESLPGRGSSFTFTLPSQDAVPVPEGRKGGSHDDDGGSA